MRNRGLLAKNSGLDLLFKQGLTKVYEHPIQGRVVIRLLATSCCVCFDGLASHPEGSSNTPSHFILGIL